MCTTKLSPTAWAGAPSASCNMPEASMATWPWGSQRTAKISAAGAAMVRWTSIRSVIGRVEPRFVGRQWEMGSLSGILDRAVNGNGAVVGVVGPPGIGKSRTVREIASRATSAGVEVLTTYCESHTTDVPFHAVAGLLRATTGSNGLDGAAARTQVRARFPGADDEDLLILEDVLGIGDPAATLPQIDPDARRRR